MIYVFSRKVASLYWQPTYTYPWRGTGMYRSYRQCWRDAWRAVRTETIVYGRYSWLHFAHVVLEARNATAI